MPSPKLIFIANLWTLVNHPSPDNEWSLDQKFQAIKDAGFDGVNWWVIPEMKSLLKKYHFRFSILIISSFEPVFEQELSIGPEEASHFQRRPYDLASNTRLWHKTARPTLAA